MSSMSCALPAAALLVGLPTAASACDGCRQAALTAVFSVGFLDTLLVLMVPVALPLAVGMAIWRLGPAAARRPGSTRGH